MTMPLDEKIGPPGYKTILPWTALVILVVLSFLIWRFYENTFTERERHRFSEDIHSISNEIISRLDKYHMVLQGGAGIFTIFEEVSREKWRAYYEYCKISTFYPGVQGIGFSRVILPAEVDQHIREVKDQGFPDYTVRPAGERDIYTAIIFLEPFDARNQRAFGFDMFSEPVRRAAMERARDTGQVSMSGKVILVQEGSLEVQPGFLIYVPIYKRSMPLHTEKDRRAAIRGYVYAPFRIHDFARSIFPELNTGICFSLYDGSNVSPETLMIDSHDPSRVSRENHRPMFAAQKTLDLYGHPWTLVFETLPGFEAAVDRYTPKITLVVGLCISLLIFFFLRTQERTTDKAFSMARDMTSALRESQATLETALAGMADAVFISDAQGRFVNFNKAFATFHKFRDIEECAKIMDEYPMFLDVFFSDGRPAPMEQWAVPRALRGETVTNVEYGLKRKDTGETWIGSYSFAPILNKDGTIIGSVVVGRDITDQKEAENALKKSEQKYRLLAENALDIIWTVDLDGRLTYISPAIEKLIGFTDAEVLNMPMTDYIVAEDCKALLESLAAELAKPPEERPVSQTREMRYKTRDGRVLEVEFTATWLMDDQGQVCGVQGNTRDMTEHKQAEANRIARLTAEAANREKSLFLSNMSHEIRTPMNAILGFAQILERDSSLSLRQMEQIRSINRSGRYLLHLINDILDMSKIEAGMIMLKPRIFHLHDLLGDLEMMFRSRTDAMGLQLLVERDIYLPDHIFCDESRLRQVLVNLVGNAVKFTEKGGVSVRVRVEPVHGRPAGEEKNMSLVVEVEDSGPGIPRKDLDSIFEAFRQSEAGTKAGGTGLGLAISRKLVEMMGGRLTVESEVGKGSCFHFDVRLEPAGTLAEKETLKPDNIVGLDLGSSPWRILIVDDIKTNRDLLLSLLKPIGFEVREAENGAGAIEIFQDWKPHAVLMDMRMPVMDGYEATRWIKADKAGAATPVIAVTASAFKESKEEILATGASAYLRKPFRMGELYEALGQCLGLNYVYSEGQDMFQIPEKIPALTPQSLAALPENLILAMQKAVAEGDILFLMELIGHAEVQNKTTALGLRALADRYDYKKLNELLGKGGSDNG